MSPTLQILAMVVVIGAVAAGSRRFHYSEPLVLVVVGVALSFVPHAFSIAITPGLVIDGLLPPLLYAAAIRTPLVNFTALRRAIALLAIGAVAFSTVAVGLTVWALLPGATLAVAFALGAVVAPPDAVAATAVGRKIGMPRTVVATLEGESLLNDASSLVALGTAVTAMSASVTTLGVAANFLWAAGGGALIGAAVALVLALVRKHLVTPVLDTLLSFAAPYVAFLPAEELGSSGVVAVVVTGLLLEHRAPYLQSATSRITERLNWHTVQFALENAVFLLIGLQVKDLITAVGADSLPWATVIPVCLATLGATIAARFVYVYATTALLRPRKTKPWSWPEATVVSWAGMRGVVTLAAVFVIPASTPHHAVLALAAFTVVAGTLLIQGMTLPALVRALKLKGPDPVEDAVALATLTTAASKAGLTRLDEILTDADSADVAAQLRARSEARVNMTWERLGRPRTDAEPPSAAYRRLRMEMLQAERDWIVGVRSSRVYDEEVLSRAMAAMDLEESLLESTGDATEHGSGAVSAGQGDCDHLRAAPVVATPTTPTGCAECLEAGTPWVHLRLCLTCGHVGCCDSSEGRHATAHFQETGHPVMRSFEPGETWRWCYVDEIPG